jgi:hypothetical protein
MTSPGDEPATRDLEREDDDAGVISYAINGESFPATAPIVADQGDWIEVHYLNEGTIAFEVDGIDDNNHLGWSVLAVGPARWLSTREQLEHALALHLQPWAAGEKANVVRLSPTKVTGRRIHRGREADSKQEA